MKVYYSLAMSYFQNYGQPDDRKKAIEYFQKVIKEFPTSEWADDVYYQLGRYYQQNNEFPKALKTYREFLTHFRRGESQFVDNAQRSIKDIAAPQLRVNSSYTYLPGSEVQLNMNWRNVNGAKITVYKMDLAKELRFDLSKGEADHNRGLSNYQEMIERIVSTNRYELLPQVLSWHLNLKNEGRHLWHNESKGLAEWRQHGEGQEEGEIDPASGTLEPGAYLVMAAASGIKAYDLILVTDIGIVTKIAGQSALFYVFNAKSGEPRVEAKVKYQYRYYDNRGHRRWSQGEGTTDGTGLLKIAFKTVLENDRSSRKQLFVTASSGAMQTFAQGNYYSHYYGNSSKWNVYAYSDRPAYRPNEEVSFKATMRVGDSGSFRTPSGRMVKVRITDARGNKVYEKAYVLNEFGTFHDKFTLDEKATLGQYNLNIYTEDLKEHLGSATLFRLEEYKLPEFLVNMKPKPKEDGSSAYRLGDVIDVELDAQYYFGGAVAEAEVEYLIYQKPYNHYYSAPRKYHWYFDESFHGRYNYYNQGTLIKKEKIKTDLEGKAFFSFETPEDSQQDLKYSIEVRVVDQSRREIASSQDIKVTRNAFYAYLTPKHNLYRPGDKAEVDIKVLTANDDPVSVDGTITVSRNWWRDRVIKEGKMITHPGYDETELFKKFIKTDEKGEVIFSFEPERDGYYVVKFTAFDDKVNEITSQTNVFVCDKQSKDLGYRYGGIQIITEK
ncbi:MAG: tetratricopeptide repeat protein, partial [Candidatus Omnitrophica bacterium]|nr:tetratricopeptide repeat protein [Candidatus Omnitrophota bacterium]